MVRRRVALGVGLVLLIVIVLVINGCLKGEKSQELKDYNHAVSTLAQESDSQVTGPLFTALAGAPGKSALDVEVQINQLRVQAQALAAKAASLSVPSSMTSAQRALLLAMNLRAEGVTKIAALVPTALGGQGKQASSLIAGDMEIFLASDVIYSQRVVPLIKQALASSGIHGLSTSPSRSLPNLGWLEAGTVLSRLTGQQTNGTSTASSGTHGSSLLGVSVGSNTLAAEPTINHISGGGSPTFTVGVENTGSNEETNVKVDITVSASGKQYKASHSINQTQPGSKVNVEIPVSGIPLGVAAKIEAYVEPVPGETNTENNKGTYLAIFSQ
ncbi:MAG TPA: hypothetical protein VHT27_06445 [Solirubrobacteraceae bacterium]|jgi:hypothetical protein|nr:hypothetical protein [Solirubrobacteraceae bacterium]